MPAALKRNRVFSLCFSAKSLFSFKISLICLISLSKRPTIKHKMVHSKPLKDSCEGSKHIAKCSARRAK